LTSETPVRLSLVRCNFKEKMLTNAVDAFCLKAY